MKKAFLILILAILIFGCNEEVFYQNESGRVYITISDAGGLMEDITSLEMTVSGVTIHSEDQDKWVELSSETRTFDLLQLKADDVMELYVETELGEGNYNQIRLDVDEVKITYQGEEQNAKLPSNVLKINVDLNMSNQSSLLDFDFIPEESLHLTGNGMIIMTPVINVAKFKDVKIEKHGKNIMVMQRRQVHEEKHGMDENGNIGKGTKVQGELTLDANGKVVKLGGPDNVEENKKGNAVDSGDDKPKAGGNKSDMTDDEPQGTEDNYPETTGEAKNKATGNAIFTVKDKNNMSNKSNPGKAPPVKTKDGMNVSSLEVTFEKLTVHTPSEEENASWITVFEGSKTLDLIELQDVEAVLGEEELEVGRYTQIRLYIASAEGEIDNDTVNITVPSNALKLVGNLEVEEDTTSIATIDFLVDRSLIKAGDKYILKPTIKLITKKGIEIKDRVKEMDMEKLEYEGGEVLEENEQEPEEDVVDEIEENEEEGSSTPAPTQSPSESPVSSPSPTQTQDE